MPDHAAWRGGPAAAERFEPQFRLLGDMIRGRAAALGDKVAIRFGSRTTSYAELERHSNQIARGLAQEGVRRADRVFYLGKNSDRYFEIYLAAAKLGAVFVPLNWRLVQPELQDIVADAGGSLLFAETEFLTLGQQLVAEGRAIGFDPDRDGALEAWRDSFAAEPGAWPVSPEDPVLQLYTSGTTGKPKGVVGTHRAMLVFRSLPAPAHPAWNRWSTDDVSLLVSPQFHIGGSGHGLQTLCAGATGIIMREFDVDRIMDLIATERLSRVYVVPAVLRMMLDHPRLREIDCSAVRSIIYGSSPIPLETLQRALDAFGCDFVQQYGMTEVLGTITALGPEDHRNGDLRRLRSAGRAVWDTQLAIVDSAGRRLGPGQSGEIVTRTPTMMAGYWRKPAETDEVLAPDGWYRTGDAGYLDEDGYLYIHDRIKDMIVSGGENVYPAEVENVLLEHPDVLEAAVVGVPDPKWGEAVKAVVVRRSGAALDAAGLIAWARGKLAGYKLPKSVEFRDALPRNGAGKVMRRSIRDGYWQGRDRQVV